MVLLHQKERQEIATSTRLSTHQSMDHPKHLPTTANSRTHRPIKRLLPLHEIRHLLGLQQRPDQRRRQMESSIYHQRRLVQTNRHVLRAHQLPGNLPNHDELDLL
jgi:hypothetical protein